jgi:hypothetical protein
MIVSGAKYNVDMLAWSAERAAARCRHAAGDLLLPIRAMIFVNGVGFG